MYGCIDSSIIYGWKEGNREFVIEHEWFENDLSLLQTYATDTVRYHAGEAVYGIPCTLDKKTGELVISETNKKEVIYYYNKFIQYCIDTKKTKIFPEIGFYSVIIGDMEWNQHLEYNPDGDQPEDTNTNDDDEDSSEETGLDDNVFIN